MEFETASLDTVSGWSEINQNQDELKSSFEAFKEANDLRLQEIEERRSADVLLEDKVDRINQRLSELSTLMQRPALDASATEPQDDLEIRAAFRSYIATGDAHALRTLQTKKLGTTTDAEGGYLVPDVIHTELDARLNAVSPFRRLARFVELEAGNEITSVIPSGEFTSTWVTEEQTRTTTTTPSFAETRIELNEIYANPAATTHFLADATIDAESWLIAELAEAFGAAEGEAFISGNGVNKPFGLLSEPLTYSASSVGPKLLARKTGRSSGFSTSKPADVLIEMAFGLPTQYRMNAKWLMNPATQATIRKFKDGNDNYLWAPGGGTTTTPSLLGFELFDEPNMPDVTAGALPIAFGDFHQAYTIIGRGQSVFIRDPYTSKPYVLFYSSRRVGGRTVNRHAYQLIRVAS